MTHRADARRNDHGFTLAEMMITVAIFALLLSIGMPALTEMVVSQRVRSASSDLYASIVYARSEAIKRNSSVELRKLAAPGGNTDWSGGWEIWGGSPAAMLRTQEALTAGIVLEGPSSPPAGAHAVIYNGAGRILGGGNPEFRLYINDVNAPRMRCTTINLTGMPSIALDADGVTANGC